MFFNHIKRNSLRSRKDNSLFFGSLVIAIVVFYVFLSLESQDVITFLKTLESEAVRKLLVLIPIVYGLSLFFVFFLIYFANKYQIQRRSHEFGLYQTLGMKRSRIFSMLMGETIWNSLIALLIGVPIALFLTELISLATAKIVGLGIIGHQFQVSWPGMIGTIGGFLGIQLLAMFLISFQMSRKDPIELLRDEAEITQRIGSKKSGWFKFGVGICLLLIAYAAGLFLLESLNFIVVAGILVVGISGTLFLFRGIATFIGSRVRKTGQKSTGLATFTGRQLQENVLHQSAFLGIGSLLILLALICLAYGVTTALGSGNYAKRTVDFSIDGSQQEIERVLNSEKIAPYIYTYYPMNLSSMNMDIFDNGSGVSWDGLVEVVKSLPDSASKESLLLNLEDRFPYFISLSSYNDLLTSMGQPEFALAPGEIALYNSGLFGGYAEDLQMALQSNPEVTFNGQTYTLSSELLTKNLVADEFITIMFALVVPDDVYVQMVGDEPPFCWNVVLDPELVDKDGLMQVLMQADGLLEASNLTYESFLSGIGRQLFFVVAGSYVSLYLGLLFLIIANTVLGLKFLMQQRSTRHRYETLLILGAKKEVLFTSVRTQVLIYFALVISVAVVSGVFGIASLKNGLWLMSDYWGSGIFYLLSSIAIAVFLATEMVYIWLIQSESIKEIKRLAA